MPEFIVVCEDGMQRHEPFPTRRGADRWAKWGHLCYGKHAIFEATNTILERFGQERCGICEEPFKITDEAGEFYDPSDDYRDEPVDSVIAHAQCGISKGYETA